MVVDSGVWRNVRNAFALLGRAEHVVCSPGCNGATDVCTSGCVSAPVRDMYGAWDVAE